MNRRRFRMAPVVVLAVLAAACGGGEDTSAEATDTTPAPATETTEATEATPTDEDMATDGMDMGSETATEEMDMDTSGEYGEPADPSEADRTIEVHVDNDFAFDPDEFEVAEGEVVTFQITNTGDIEHEFVLGDEKAQQAMEEAMASGDGHAHSGDMSNAVTVHAGETAELTWRFTTAGTVLVGCHVPGHYDAGMRGTVAVG